MVSRFRAFTIAVGWIATGLAVGIAALYLAGNGVDDDGLVATATAVYRAGFFWWLVLVPGCVVVAGLWIGLGSRNARTSAWLGGQAALIGLATALFALLLVLIVSQTLGSPLLGVSAR